MKKEQPLDNTCSCETVETVSGNVFADLGLSNPEERLARAKLVHRISEIIKERKLTQAKAGEILGIDQANGKCTTGKRN